jgi:hypothetical protein
MITIRPAAARGRTKIDWLDSRHTFSFGEYRDPAHMGFRTLRVINDDVVAPGSGFGTHGHADMEIFTWVLEGELEHKDSLGNGSVIRPGDAQRMSAGTGIRHSEFNPSKVSPVRLLQIWILPERAGLAPGYEQRTFTPADLRGGFRLVASRDGREGSVTLHQDAGIHAARLGAGESGTVDVAPERHAWVQVARGSAALNGEVLGEGDGAAVSGVPRLEMRAQSDAEVLVFDLG